jgi:hypothetical protein
MMEGDGAWEEFGAKIPGTCVEPARREDRIGDVIKMTFSAAGLQGRLVPA